VRGIDVVVGRHDLHAALGKDVLDGLVQPVEHVGALDLVVDAV
jgi:hypothetical protein